jgi:hypothetical protein
LSIGNRTGEQDTTMKNPLHVFGDLFPLVWPKGASVLYRVESWRGSYVATYASEADANAHARRISGRFDAKVCPVRRTGA